jgi:AraC-like DNA-binding protein
MQKLLTHGRFLTFGAYPRKFIQLMENEYHIPAEKLLDGVNMTREALDQPDLLIPFADCVRIFQNGAALCPNGDLSLRFAAQIRSASHGLLGAAILTAATLQEAVQLFYDYVGLIAPFVLLHLEDRRHSRTLVLEIISDVPVAEVFTYDILQLANFNILKMILGERTRELVFHFAYPAPAHIAAYSEYFDCHLQFNASFNGVSIPTEFMETRIPTADADTHRLLVGQIREQMDAIHAQSSFVDAVRYHLKRQGGPLPRMNLVANVFNMSARTFRNRLRRYNTTYQTLLDKERHEQAVHYLRHTDKSVKEIAYVLGFQESSNFSRVFKKWTGVTPLDFRRGMAHALN